MKLRSGIIVSPEIESSSNVELQHPVIFSNPVISNSDQDIYADLHYVSEAGHTEYVFRLLKNGADTEAKDCVSQSIFVCNLL